MNTPNYNLYLEDDDTTRFFDWRQKMNGSRDSNMIKIDTALGEKADNSVCIDGVLLASAWIGDSAPYSQSISVQGLTSERNGSISVAQNITTEQLEAVLSAVLSVSGQADGALTIAASKGKPSVDIPVSIILLG